MPFTRNILGDRAAGRETSVELFEKGRLVDGQARRRRAKRVWVVGAPTKALMKEGARNVR